MYRNEDRTGALEEFKKADKQDGGQHIRGDADGPGQNFPTTSRQRDKTQYFRPCCPFEKEEQ